MPLQGTYMYREDAEEKAKEWLNHARLADDLAAREKNRAKAEERRSDAARYRANAKEVMANWKEYGYKD